MRVVQVAIIGAVVGLASPALAAHSGSAPIHPKEADDQTFVADTGAGLDTGCTFRSGGPLRINVDIDRYLGETNSDGTLADVQTLVGAKVVAPTAKIRFPAFDVDDKASVPPPYFPEIDIVSFNGHQIRTLTGVNNGWIMQEFEVPIAWVKFSSARGANGSEPAPGKNEIRIDIDTANSAQLWCTAVDWVEISVKNMAPVLMVHGITGNPTTWDQGVRQFFEAVKIPHEPNIQLGPNDSVDANGKLLSTLVPAIASSFGAERVHLLVHSKGGKDSNRYLSAYYDPDAVEVLSLHTLSTPHHGSIQADLSIAQRTLTEAESDDPDVEDYLNNDWWAEDNESVPQSPGLDDLQIGTSLTFLRNNPLPGSVVLHTWGADADTNNDGNITNAESTPLLDAVPVFREAVATTNYRVLRDVAGIRITANQSNFLGLNTWDQVDPIPTATPQDNDLAVTDTSSQHSAQRSHTGPSNRNHSTIKDTTRASQVLAKIRADFPLN